MEFIQRSDAFRFAQVWSPEPGRWVTREGIVGRVGTLSEVVDPSITESMMRQRWIDSGFSSREDEESSWVVVQWPMKSASGTKRDSWLIERATEEIEAHLAVRGLGEVDGHDRGKRIGPDGGFVINLFCAVVDAEKAATSVMTCLRQTRLDPTRATIAVSPVGTDDYVVRYERVANKLPGAFRL